MSVKVFIAYSHQDKKYLQDDSLLSYLKGLEGDGEVEFWSDERITTGDLWDDEIKAKIRESQIALLLISQAFLNSQYIKKVEISQFLRQRKTEGMVLFPIILSPCEWERHDWLEKPNSSREKRRRLRPISITSASESNCIMKY